MVQKSQQMRNEVLKEFRETPNALLLATDVASRGLGMSLFSANEREKKDE